MACKSPPNFRHPHRKCCQPQQHQRPVVELNQIVEMGPLPRDTKETGGLPVREDHGLYPPALRVMLGSDNYQMVLVPRGEWDRTLAGFGAPNGPFCGNKNTPASVLSATIHP
jgi:hypothetical protein